MRTAAPISLPCTTGYRPACRPRTTSWAGSYRWASSRRWSKRALGTLQCDAPPEGVPAAACILFIDEERRPLEQRRDPRRAGHPIRGAARARDAAARAGGSAPPPRQDRRGPGRAKARQEAEEAAQG